MWCLSNTNIKKTQPDKKIATVNKDYIVKIVNNSNGIVCFTPRYGRSIELLENGDFEYITVSELQEIKNSARNLLTNYDLIPVEVVEGGCTISDVIRFLGIQNYFSEDMDEQYFDNMILRTKTEDFKSIVMSANQGFKDQIARRAVKLYQNGDFTFYPKMEFLKELTGNDLLFEK